MEYILDLDADIAFLTETWLESEKNYITAEAKSYGYKLLHDRRKDRDKEKGGGVGILVKTTITAKQTPVKHYISFEHTIVKLPLGGKKFMILISVYRLSYVAIAIFLEEFAELLDLYTISSESFVIAGDFNIHVETDSPDSNKFREMLDIYDLKQHVNEPTHREGHTLDVVLTPNIASCMDDVEVIDTDISDHFLVSFKLLCNPVTVRQMKTITYRKMPVDMVRFGHEVKRTLDALPATNNILTKIGNYNSAMSDLVSEYAPMKTREIKIVPEAPWFDAEYADQRKVRRRAEKKFRRTGLETDKKIYKALRKETINSSFKKKKSFITEKLQSGCSRTLYSVVNQLIDNNKKEVVLPKASSDKELADKFLIFFKDKIEKIRATFSESLEEAGVPKDDFHGQVLSVFKPTTIEEVKEIVMSNEIKCSPEDPVPVKLLSSNIDVFIPYWVEIVNLSLELGDMDGMTSAVVIPLIKELSSLVDTENFKNYRPVSNLVLVSKIIERVVQNRLEEHMIKNKLSSVKNYGYKKSHSTELLLLKVVDDLFSSFDKNIPTVVILLDLSAAFDTVDHKKLLEILENEIGIRGTALNWFKSFITNRTQKVKIGETHSDTIELLYGVAQGSVLGPALFKIYIRSLYRYVAPTDFEIEGFADDHQLYKQFLITVQRKALGEDINNCLQHLAMWMNEYFLKLNQTKTKIMVIAPPSIQKQIVIRGVFVEGICIRFVETAKNLGIMLDNILSFESQVNKVVKASYMFIKKLHQVKGFLLEEQLKQLVCSYVLQRLDYCNSLYYGMNSSLIDKLQRVQHCAARLISKDRISSSNLDRKMIEFHWLKVKHRILYKQLVIVHNCLHLKAPEEIMCMFRYAESIRTMKLQEKRCFNKYGERAFSHSGPKLWNLLPMNIREEHETEEFKKSLKSFLMMRGDEYCSWIKMR